MKANPPKRLLLRHGPSGCQSPARAGRALQGFTLLELTVVLAIVAVVTTLAIPSFMRLVQSSTMSNNVNTFMADLRFARSESMRRGGGVVMCRSDAPEAVSPICNTTSGPSGQGWVSGWIVYLDANKDGVIDAGDLLRMQSPIARMDSIIENGGNASSIFRFTATGRLFNASSATSLQFGGSAYASDVQRVLCVNPGGRARIAGNGGASCGADS